MDFKSLKEMEIVGSCCQLYILSPCLFNLCAVYIMRNAGLEEAQAGIKIASDMLIHHPYGRKWRRTKEPLDESQRGERKSWLKAQHSENEDHGVWSLHFMVNRWGNSVRLYFLGFQSHCRWWLQPWNEKTLTPWKESYGQPAAATAKSLQSCDSVQPHRPQSTRLPCPWDSPT